MVNKDEPTPIFTAEILYKYRTKDKNCLTKTINITYTVTNITE